MRLTKLFTAQFSKIESLISLNNQLFFVSLMLILLLGGCQSLSTNKNTPDFVKASSKEVNTVQTINGLQRSALTALQQGNLDGAKSLLQQALIDEPQNPWNWYYMAELYRQSGEGKSCVEMVQRSMYYDTNGSNLHDRNIRLNQQCLEMVGN